ncbi:hypothetical protein [Arthrobacter alpinus]|uniref:hypothetical protein n=1 Tax=Arthrobacter alpinus TaxID=656366 RepID=UPI001EF64AB5|nr:hypothetical protein [Arthrobacter alpinus]
MPADVFAAAVDHPVRVTLRDGEAHVLMSESSDQARVSPLELAAQLVAVSTSADGSLATRMSDRFPSWCETAMAIAAGVDRESVEWLGDTGAVDHL